MTMEANRRTTARKRTLKGAKVAFGDFRFTYDCVVRNVSPEGAMVRCAHASEVPDDFHLYDPSEQTLQRAEVVWRTDRDLGIHFLGDAVSIHGSNDPRHARFRFL